MDRLRSSRLFRCLVCLILVCCLLFSVSVTRVQASSLGAAAIVKGSIVTGNPYVVCGAILVALGICAGVETGVFETVVNGAVDFLDTAGGWIEDGAMQVFKTVNASGETKYYVEGALVSLLQSWSWYQDACASVNMYSAGFPISYQGYTFTCSAPVQAYYTHSVGTSSYGYYVTLYSASPFTICITHPSGSIGTSTASATGAVYSANLMAGTTTVKPSTPVYDYYAIRSYVIANCVASDSPLFGYTDGLSVGALANTAIDYDTFPDVYSDYMRSQLRVINTGGGQDPDDNGNNWKWYQPLALGATLATIATMVQSDQWTGTSPEEFPETSTVTEFEILDEPEIDGYQGLEVSPLSDPDADAGSDSDSDTDPTTDPDAEAGSNPDSGTDAGTDAGTDTGTDAGSSSDPDASSNPVSQFVVDLTEFFPFCIPFDIYEFFTYLVAEPVAPVFHWEFQDLAGNVYEVDVDLSPWDSFAALFRDMQLILYIFGLMMLTRKFIKW